MWKLSAEQKSEIATRYAAGESAIVLGATFGVSNVAVLGVVRRRGGTIRSNSEGHRRLALDEGVFAVVTEHSAYWTGFLMADGSVHRNSVAVVLSDIDECHLEALRSFLGAKHKIIRSPNTSRFGGRDFVRLEVKSARLVADLAAFGVIANKTHRAEVVGLENDRHFWRGVVDGDGWIGSGNRRVADNAQLELIGSMRLMEQFAAFVAAVHPGCAVSAKPYKSIHRVGLSGRTARAIIDCLYGGATIGLARKTNAALNILASGRNIALRETENRLL